jgi:hypothetical protein
MMANATKSTHVTFPTRKKTCPPVTLNTQIPQEKSVKYLGVHLDRQLLWKIHIQKKKKQLDNKYKIMWWLFGKKSQLSVANKLLVYKVILKPIWTYACQLWGTASKNNIKIIERWQNKKLRHIMNADCYIRNKQRKRHSLLPVSEEIKPHSSRYETRLENHSNTLAINLLDNSEKRARLRRHGFLDLPYRFSE